jgi:hypothetical protein
LNSNWQGKLKSDPVPWLLKGDPWTKYRTLTDILEVPPASDETQKMRTELLQHQQVRSLVTETSEWFPRSATRHNDSKLCHYKLMMLAEFGLGTGDEGINQIVNRAMEHREDDLFAIREELPEKAKGFVRPEHDAVGWHALPCDSPVITYSLLLLGVNDPVVEKSVEKLKEKWETPQGWFCHFFFVESQYKKLNAGCPMAGLMALEVFSQIPELKESAYARNAFEPLKFHKEYGKSIYYFGRSRRFWTLKYPFIWYNALYLADVLTRFEFLKGDALVKDLVDWIENVQDEQGRFKATSTWMPYKDWDFAGKKAASPWITMLCCRILKRWYE